MNGRIGSGTPRLLLAASVVALAAVLGGCTATGAGAPPSSTPSQAPSVAPSEEPTESPETPAPEATLDANGSALQNLDYFDSVNQRLIADQETPDGRAFIDGLVAAGFDKAAMEVTPDRTAIDLPADNIQFAVRIGDECLIGQFGNTGYVSNVADVLGTGKCLVGRTRPIDW